MTPTVTTERMDTPAAMSGRPLDVLILYEGEYPGGDFGHSIADGFRAHGCRVEFADRSQPWSGAFDVTLAYGPFHRESSMIPPAQHLLSLPPERRPIFIWWLTEGVPDPGLPQLLVQAAARLRVALDRSPLASLAPGFAMRGHRLRVLGELHWLAERRILDILAVTSASRAAYLARTGLSPITLPLGYHALYGDNQGLERDIDVCFLGQLAPRRRMERLDQVRRELARREIQVTLASDLYWKDRTEFLNRSKLMINILRASQDFVGQRFLLAAANRVLVVSEPIADHAPFVPGRHIIITPLSEMAATIEHYLRHPAERERIVQEAYRFATTELTMVHETGILLTRARELMAARRLGQKSV
ncbi:MAG: glycosyltransferase [Anaerolineae bacterium]